MRIRGKIYMSAGIPLVCLVVLSAIGYFTMHNTAAKVTDVSDNTIMPLIQTEFPAMLADNESIQLLLNADRDAYQSLTAIMEVESTRDADKLKELDTSCRENLQQVEDRTAQASKEFDEDGKVLYADFSKLLAGWKTNSLELLDRSIEVNSELVERDDRYQKLTASFDDFRDTLDEIVGMHEQLIEEPPAPPVETASVQSDQPAAVPSEEKTTQDQPAAVAAAEPAAPAQPVQDNPPAAEPVAAAEQQPQPQSPAVDQTQWHKNIALLLNADRDAYQALVAMELCMSNTDPKVIADAVESYESNLQQVYDRVGKASANFDDKMNAAYKTFKEKLDAWKVQGDWIAEVSQETAQDLIKINTLAAETQSGFGTMRDKIDEMTGYLEKRIADAAAHNIQSEEQAMEDIAQIVSSSHASLSVFLTLAIITVIGVTVIASLIAAGISRSLARAVDMIQDVAQGEGDLTRRLVIKGKDELADIAHWFNVFVEKLHDMILQVIVNSQDLTQSSQKMVDLSDTMNSQADMMRQQAESAENCTSSVSSTMSSMSASAEQLSSNIRSVSSAVEEMTVSINEVAKNAEQASQVADKASVLANESNEKMATLGDAADEIGKVIEVIQDIAEQTNLLALNATIEAARAGEAGKGFAVVATEVKELARQTAEATEDISKRIAAIQTSAGDSVKAISEIVTVIHNVNDVSRTIASAVEEQSITSREIAGNVAQAAKASEMVSSEVNNTMQSNEQVVSSIHQIDQASQSNVEDAQSARKSGSDVQHLAQQLNQLVTQFKVEQRQVDPTETADSTEEVLEEVAQTVE